MLWEYMVGEKYEELVTFEFLIRDPGGVAQIQYVPQSIFPNFHGLENEDPDEFLFQLEILCRAHNVQNLIFFPSYFERRILPMVHELRW